MPKRRRGDHDDDDGRRAAANRKHHRRGQEQEQQRLYLIFDDWPWGYSIREMNLQQQPLPSSLPQPFIQIEVPRGYPNFFAAVGTKILATQCRNSWDADSVPGGFLPIIDVRSRGVNFGPGEVCQDIPVFIPVGDDQLFCLDTLYVRKLSLKPLWPPRQEHPHSGQVRWPWRERQLPFERVDVTSYAVHPDERTVLVSTSASTGDGDGEDATFALDTDKFDDMVEELVVWRRIGEWSLPFAGHAYFVHCLDAFVGLSKDRASLGHLCSSSFFSGDCEAATAATDTGSGRRRPAWKLGKEKLFSDDPAETHVGATLVHMGGRDFCLVQCVSIAIGGDDGGNAGTDRDELIEELQHKKDTNVEEGDDSTTAGHEHQQLEKEEEGGHKSYLYRLTTFSICYDDNGDLTTGDTCRMQCYKVPQEITKDYLFLSDPVAFWL